jgi:antitoxin (DNA-binding transcriptional repressor) of toxin-antitoxin stability system
MTTVNMHEAKSTLSKLVQQLESGAETEIIIARNGKPVARLVREPAAVDVSKRLGIAKGLFTVPDSIDRENDAIAKLFGEGAR